jgi:hypothetical protein
MKLSRLLGVARNKGTAGTGIVDHAPAGIFLTKLLSRAIMMPVTGRGLSD